MRPAGQGRYSPGRLRAGVARRTDRYRARSRTAGRGRLGAAMPERIAVLTDGWYATKLAWFSSPIRPVEISSFPAEGACTALARLAAPRRSCRGSLAGALLLRRRRPCAGDRIRTPRTSSGQTGTQRKTAALPEAESSKLFEPCAVPSG